MNKRKGEHHKSAKKEDDKKEDEEKKKPSKPAKKIKGIFDDYESPDEDEYFSPSDEDDNLSDEEKELERDRERQAAAAAAAEQFAAAEEAEQKKARELALQIRAGPSSMPEKKSIVLNLTKGKEDGKDKAKESDLVKDSEKRATMNFDLSQMFDTTLGRRSRKGSLLFNSELNPCDESFLQAVEQSDQSTASKLLTEGADVNTSREDNVTGLHMAAERGDLHMAKLLIAQPEINVNTRTVYGYTPLYLAAQFGRDSIVVLLLSNKAKVNKCDQMGRTALHVAVFQGHFSTVLLLLRHGADVNAQDTFGDAPLYISIIPRPNARIASFLLNMGADPNVKGSDSKGILLEAVLNSNLPNSIKVVQMLVRNGANINTVDSIGGRSVLHLVAMTGDVAMAEALIALGANIHAKNYAGKTPLEVARLNESYGVYSLLNSMIN